MWATQHWSIHSSTLQGDCLLCFLHANSLLMTWHPISLRKLMQLEENAGKLPPPFLPPPYWKCTHSTFLPLQGMSQATTPPSSLHHHSLLSWVSSISLQTYYSITLLLKKISPDATFSSSYSCIALPSFLSKALVTIVNVYKYLSCYSLLKSFCWCFWPHDSVEYVFIKDSGDIPVAKPIGQSCMLSPWLLRSLEEHLVTFSNSGPPLHLVPRTPHWPGCLPPWLLPLFPCWLFFISLNL